MNSVPVFAVGRMPPAPTADMNEGCWVLRDDGGQRALMLHHRGEGDVLRAFGEGDDLAAVAARQEILGMCTVNR
jgi:hypothetical protein